MAITRKCICCEHEYEYCPNCAKSKQPAWKVTFCSEACKDLFNIVSAYNTKRIGKAQMQAFIAEHGITEASKYTEPIRKVLVENAVPEGTVRKMVDTPTFYSRRRRKKNRTWNYT